MFGWISTALDPFQTPLHTCAEPNSEALSSVPVKVTLGGFPLSCKFYVRTEVDLASLADALLVRHAIFQKSLCEGG